MVLVTVGNGPGGRVGNVVGDACGDGDVMVLELPMCMWLVVLVMVVVVM